MVAKGKRPPWTGDGPSEPAELLHCSILAYAGLKALKGSSLSVLHPMPTLAYLGTLNNYTPEDVAILRTPNSNLNYFIAGHEVAPTTGTPHLQIYFQLAKQTKITTIKNWGGPWAKIGKLQPPTGSDEENYKYCRKIRECDPVPNEVWFEWGTRKAMGKKGARSDLAAVKDAIERGLSYNEICDAHFDTVAKYNRFIREQIQERDGLKARNSLREGLESLSLRPWQQDLVNAVTAEPHPRKIQWIWSTAGETGKSTMATYLGVLHGATVLELGKGADLKHIWAKAPSKIAIFDLTRATEEHLDGLYSMAEQLKNGRLVTTKYDGSTIYFPIPHVVFFANFPPNMEKWSQDRYLVWKLD